MSDTFQYDVFLSFSGKDEERVKLLWSDLSSNGLRVFWSDKTLKESVGKSFFSVIQNALAESEHFLLCCTDNAMQSSWVKLEYETFFTEFHIKNKDRLLILYHDNNFNRENIPPFLKGLQISTSLDEIIRLLGGADIRKIMQDNESLKKHIAKLTRENLSLISEKEMLVSRYSMLEYENNLLKNKISFDGKKIDLLSTTNGISILVIDDEEPIRLLLEEELKEIGYTVFLASSGEEGINIFNRTQVDIVILDINMPGINGLEILRILKNKKNNVPVVLYSAFTEFKEKIETWAADAYVKKSADLRELFDTIGRFLLK